VDSPPTVHGSRVIFGSADGCVYCLDSADGQLAWRFQAAPRERRIVSYDRLESAWPVHGSVLVQDDVVYAVAGRSSYLDGGMLLHRLDVRTGESLSATPITTPALPDVLSSDGSSVFMRHRRFDLAGQPQASDVEHLYSPAGFLDDSWWHRTYWLVGTGMRSGWGSWPVSGNLVPAGRLLVTDDTMVYGFGRFNQYHRDGSHVGLGQTRYSLYASSKLTAEQPAGQAKRRAPAQAALGGDVPARWSRSLPLLARAMLLSDQTIFVAGPPDVVAYAADDETDRYHIASPATLEMQQAALAGERGGLLLAVSAADGQTVAEHPLPSLPAWDALAAAGGRLYLATGDGQVLCFAGPDESGGTGGLRMTPEGGQR
jgi:outer membrane protein assembly factor BamB